MMNELRKREFKTYGLLAFGISAVVLVGGIAAYHYWLQEDNASKAQNEKKES